MAADAQVSSEVPRALRRDRVLFMILLFLAFALRRPEPIDVTTQWLPADATWFAYYAIAFFGLFSERSTLLRSLRTSSLPLLVILLLAGASMLWSNEPGTTARRAIALFGSSAVALYFVRRLGLRAFAKSLLTAIIVTAVISVPLIALVPSYGLQDGFGYQSAWRGCFFSKNDLGQVMALGIITLAMLSEGVRGVRRRLVLACFGLFSVLLLGSQSAGSIASTVVFAVAFPVWLRVRKSGSLTRALQVSLIAGLALVVAGITGFGAQAALGALGRDATLTGRTDVWQAAINAIGERPALGYGYREFWNKDGDSKYFLTPNEDGWLADTAHNGFIEVALDIGLVGEAVLIVYLVVGAAYSSKFFWQGKDRLSAWPICILFDVVTLNFTDRSFLTQNSVHWIVLLAAVWFASAPRANGLARSPKGQLHGREVNGVILYTRQAT